MSFKTWYDNADMPEQINGKWVDLETGESFSSRWTAPRFQPSGDTKAHRAAAKLYGGKALTGSQKQKKWAESIRFGIITNVEQEAAELLCTLSNLCGSSKFWIENRTKDAEQFQSFVFEQQRLLKAHREAGNPDPAATAQQYNDLTAQWGFK